MNLKESMLYWSGNISREQEVKLVNEDKKEYEEKARFLKNLVAKASNEGKIVVYLDPITKKLCKLTSSLKFFDVDTGDQVRVNIENTDTSGGDANQGTGKSKPSDYHLEPIEKYRK